MVWRNRGSISYRLLSGKARHFQNAGRNYSAMIARCFFTRTTNGHKFTRMNFNGLSGFLLETGNVSRAITWRARHKNSCLFVFIRGSIKYRSKLVSE